MEISVTKSDLSWIERRLQKLHGASISVIGPGYDFARYDGFQSILSNDEILSHRFKPMEWSDIEINGQLLIKRLLPDVVHRELSSYGNSFAASHFSLYGESWTTPGTKSNSLVDFHDYATMDITSQYYDGDNGGGLIISIFTSSRNPDVHAFVDRLVEQVNVFLTSKLPVLTQSIHNVENWKNSPPDFKPLRQIG